MFCKKTGGPGPGPGAVVTLAAMRFTPLPLAGAFAIDLDPRPDARGAFARTFCQDTFAAQGLATDFVQANQSWNLRQGTLRGMHYQHPPHAEAKYIRCIAGAVFDVIIDIRQGSATFLQHVGLELSAVNMRGLYVPPGFAHGFITLQDDTQLAYMHSARYAPGAEGGLRYDDPRLAIAWPLPPAVMSEKDEVYPLLEAGFTGITLG